MKIIYKNKIKIRAKKYLAIGHEDNLSYKVAVEHYPTNNRGKDLDFGWAIFDSSFSFIGKITGCARITFPLKLKIFTFTI